MKHVRHVMLTIVASISLVACASQTNKAASGGPDRLEKMTASGFTKEGCFLNLKMAAREKNVRLIPDDVEVEANWLMLIFPFLNQGGYQCSGGFTERTKRPSSKDSIYPFE